MKAAVYYETGGPEVLRYEDVPDPPCPPHGVLIDVKAISIEGGDVLNRAGGEMPRKPHVVGYQCAGVIRDVGANVTDRAPGQRVVAAMPFGSHASMAAVAAAATWLLPEGLDFERAATVPVTFGTAADAIFEFGHLQAGETVLVQAGGSGVGLAAVQLAKRAAATVLATAGSDEKCARLREFGVDHPINYRTQDLVAETKRLTDGRGAHLVVDGIGGRTLERSIEAAGYRGRIVSYGRAGREPSPPDTSALSAMNRTLTGLSLALELGLNPARVYAMIGRHLEDIASGELRVVIDRTFPLSEAAAAHAYIESRAAFGRVVMVV